ncbi:nodulation protein NfeD [bacterium]|nr:nodulation protein NfeD [bacterium]MBU1989341.1 nodulation protein NfeD [bacterium]
MKRLLLLLLLTFLPLFSEPLSITQLQINGVIGPASSSYLKEGIQEALRLDSKMILIKLDTPGGLSTSMREMIQEITNSPIPVVVYVFPKGAHAASAGTYLLYAAHVAAMAPGTNLGAATPVNLMPMQKDLNGSAASTLEKKALNDAVAYIKSLAQMNERNVSWAQEAVAEAKSLSAEDALKYGVIDFIAEDTGELLSKIDGKTLNVLGKKRVLKSKDAVVHRYEADWKTKFLSTITNPNIAYIFLLIAVYGIFFELMNPGGVIPGVIGIISGVVSLYALNMIPFNYAGLLLIILGISFMIAEVFVSGFGILGIGGVLSFAFGSVLLFDANTLGSSVSIPLIVAFTLVSLAFFIILVRVFLRSRSAKVVSGAEEMIGAIAEVVEYNEKGCRVLCHGEIWNCTCREKLQVGERVQVSELLGLVLRVKPIKE